MKEVAWEELEPEEENMVLYSEYRRQFNSVYEDLFALSEAANAGQKSWTIDEGRYEDCRSTQESGGLQRAIDTVGRAARQRAGDAGMP